jgi:arsenite methyltransferase
MEHLLTDIKEQVATHYREAAIRLRDAGGSCCHAECGSDQYEEAEDLAAVSLGCGNPTAVAELSPGETVLDLGSGGGLDVILSARRVLPGGRAIGLDMTPEMLELARHHAATQGVDNVEFLQGEIEQIPLPDSSVDVVISNCVINLSADKPAVFREIARVLRPGGRIGVSDIVAGNHLSVEERAERGSWAGCIAGALSEDEYRRGLEQAGLEAIAVELAFDRDDGLYNAIIRARKPT